MGEKMAPFVPDSSQCQISLVINVWPTGDVYVRYELLSGEMPRQMPAMFSSREQLALRLRALGLLNEAALVTLSETETFALTVPYTAELMEILGFNKTSIIH
jgi:hypothetical protein